MLRYLIAGESHGAGLTGIVEGLPAGMKLNIEFINRQLKRRQIGFGRGPRMKIENDKARIISGLCKGKTIGSPITVYIENKDYSIDKLPSVFSPRPGHADLAGYLKYHPEDIRSILERASARETAMRTAVGAIARLFLKEFGLEIISHVIQIGSVKVDIEGIKIRDIFIKPENSSLRCISINAEKKMIQRINKAAKEGDTLGGIFEVIAVGVVPGIGSYIQWDKRLDTALAGAVMSIPGIKGVEIGLGFGMAGLPGSKVHDSIYYKKPFGFYRKTNRSGGIEGGISNGEPVRLRAVMKPIATLGKPLDSVNIKTKRPGPASVQRSDVCVVPSAGVVGEAMAGMVLANAYLEKFGGDNIKDIKTAYSHYLKRIKN